jgi:hypothetical protein
VFEFVFLLQQLCVDLAHGGRRVRHFPIVLGLHAAPVVLVLANRRHRLRVEKLVAHYVLHRDAEVGLAYKYLRK